MSDVAMAIARIAVARKDRFREFGRPFSVNVD